jgi:hypothetical protein
VTNLPPMRIWITLRIKVQVVHVSWLMAPVVSREGLAGHDSQLVGRWSLGPGKRGDDDLFGGPGRDRAGGGPGVDTCRSPKHAPGATRKPCEPLAVPGGP